MNGRLIQTMIVAVGLTIASAPVFASQDISGGDRGATHKLDRSARFEKHMARLHDALKLTSAQEDAWTQFANKMKPVKMDHRGAKDWKGMNTPDRLDKMLANMKSREQRLGERAMNVRTFYAALSREQQRTFDRRFREFQSRHHRHGQHAS
jgi:periplasmic protein CpxP/Spy